MPASRKGRRKENTLSKYISEYLTIVPPKRLPSGVNPSASNRYTLLTLPSKLSGIMDCLIDTACTFQTIDPKLVVAKASATINGFFVK